MMKINMHLILAEMDIVQICSSETTRWINVTSSPIPRKREESGDTGSGFSFDFLECEQTNSLLVVT